MKFAPSVQLGGSSELESAWISKRYSVVARRTFACYELPSSILIYSTMKAALLVVRGSCLKDFTVPLIHSQPRMRSGNPAHSRPASFLFDLNAFKSREQWISTESFSRGTVDNGDRGVGT